MKTQTKFRPRSLTTRDNLQQSGKRAEPRHDSLAESGPIRDYGAVPDTGAALTRNVNRYSPGRPVQGARALPYAEPLLLGGARALTDSDAIAILEPLMTDGIAVPGGGILSNAESLNGSDSPALSHLVGLVVESWRCYRSWLREEITLTLRIKAWCRRLCPQPEAKKRDGREVANPSADALYLALLGKGDHPQLSKATYATAPLFRARAILTETVAEEKKTLCKLAAGLPGAKYCNETVGISLFSLAALVGECPGISGNSFLDFATPQRVWKRFGLGVVDGQRQHKAQGEEGIRQAYSPQRRSIVWVIGESALKKGHYRELYLAIKERERAKWEAKGYTILPAKDLPKDRGPLHKSAGDLHNRAKCLMEKEMLRDVWLNFRAEATGQPVDVLRNEWNAQAVSLSA